MPLPWRKKTGKTRIRRYYREDGSVVEISESQDRETWKLEAERNWNNVKRLKEIGSACLHNRYFDLAEWIFERVMELDEDDKDAVMQFASSLLNQKKWEEAREIVANHLARMPNSSVAHQFMAAIHEHFGESDAGMLELYQALESDPNNENALWMLYWKTHNREGDAGAVKKMLELVSNFPQAWGPKYIIARHYEDIDREMAVDYYEKAMKNEDTDKVLIPYTAFLGKNGKYRDLINVVEERRRRRSVDFRVLFNLAEAYLEEGRADEALEISLELQTQVPPPYKRRLESLTRRIRSIRQG